MEERGRLLRLGQPMPPQETWLRRTNVKQLRAYWKRLQEAAILQTSTKLSEAANQYNRQVAQAAAAFPEVLGSSKTAAGPSRAAPAEPAVPAGGVDVACRSGAGEPPAAATQAGAPAAAADIGSGGAAEAAGGAPAAAPAVAQPGAMATDAVPPASSAPPTEPALPSVSAAEPSAARGVRTAARKRQREAAVAAEALRQLPAHLQASSAASSLATAMQQGLSYHSGLEASASAPAVPLLGAAPTAQWATQRPRSAPSPLWSGGRPMGPTFQPAASQLAAPAQPLAGGAGPAAAPPPAASAGPQAAVDPQAGRRAPKGCPWCPEPWLGLRRSAHSPAPGGSRPGKVAQSRCIGRRNSATTIA